MNVRELDRNRLEQLKSDYLITLADRGERQEPSWGEILNADEIVPDEVIFEEYDGVEFVDDDFVDDREEMPWDYGQHFD